MKWWGWGLDGVGLTANELQGETVRVALNQVLYVDTGSLHGDVDTAEIADDSVASFLPGANAGDFLSYPGFTPLKVGSTRVTMTNNEDGLEPFEFTIEVTPAAG